jgi:DNA replication protein DnaC
MAIANAVNGRGDSVYFATTPDLLDDLKATFDGGDDESYATRFERIRTVGLLVLDDIGAEKKSDFNTEKLFQLINHRYNEPCPPSSPQTVSMCLMGA